MWTHRRSGNTNQRGNQDHRDPYERDRTRVIHCPAFRRLQRKTQILGTDEGDFHRTRLTHSLEVASIGRSIVRNLSKSPQFSSMKGLLPNDDLISVICLLHDIGHPPFGHGGEVALNYMMRRHGGFEGNGQTLRLLTKVENSYGHYGLDLTRRTLLGILKYPVHYSLAVCHSHKDHNSPSQHAIRINDWLPPKAYFDSEQEETAWILLSLGEADRALFQSLKNEPDNEQHGQAAYHNFDCSIMNTADDIAYGVHDLEDAIHLQLITREQLATDEFIFLFNEAFTDKKDSEFLKRLFSPETYLCKQAIGELVNYFITATEPVITNPDFDNDLLKYNIALHNEARKLLDFLIRCVYENVIDSHEARTFEYGGQNVVLRLFEAISSNPNSLLNKKYRILYQNAAEDSELAAFRVICDYIANMTDEYAYRMHERLFGFNTRTLFERL